MLRPSASRRPLEPMRFAKAPSPRITPPEVVHATAQTKAKVQMRLIAVLAPLPMGPTQESRKGLAVAHDCGTRVRVVGLV
jgi:hypothetical protein